MQYVSSFTSTITGIALTDKTAETVEKNVKSGTITSSPSPILSAFRAISIACVPLATEMPALHP